MVNILAKPVSDLLAKNLVGKCEHATVRLLMCQDEFESLRRDTYMVDDDNLLGTEELLGDNHRAECIMRSPPGVSDDMCLTFRNSKTLAGVDASVHASDNSNLTAQMLEGIIRSIKREDID